MAKEKKKEDRRIKVSGKLSGKIRLTIPDNVISVEIPKKIAVTSPNPNEITVTSDIPREVRVSTSKAKKETEAKPANRKAMKRSRKSSK